MALHKEIIMKNFLPSDLRDKPGDRHIIIEREIEELKNYYKLKNRWAEIAKEYPTTERLYTLELHQKALNGQLEILQELIETDITFLKNALG